MTEEKEDGITLISVAGARVGIVGLTEFLAEAKARSFTSEAELAKFLLARVKTRNYVVQSWEEEYAQALLREFKMYVGQPVASARSEGSLEVKVLGPGCVNCDRLEQECIAVLAELNIAADVEHVGDVKRFAEYGVAGVPALIINKRVKSIGRVPTREQIKTWLREET